MQRIAGADVATDLFGAGKHGFQGRVVGIQAATEVTTDFLNKTVQQEPCTLVEKCGQALDSSRTDQMYRSLLMMQFEAALLNPTARTAGSSFVGSIYAVCESAHVPGLIIAVGANGNIQRSTNYGATWTVIAPAASYTGSFRAVVETSPIDWVIVGGNGEIQHSTDTGLTWTHKNAAGGYTGTFFGIAYSGSESNSLVIVGGSGEIQTTTDIDAGVFTKRTQAGGFAGTFFGAARSDSLDMWVIVGTSGEIETSPDGTTWTKRTQAGGVATSLVSVTFGYGDLFVIAGSAGEIQYSATGLTWSRPAVQLPNTLNFNFVTVGVTADTDLAEVKYCFVAVGDGGAMAASIDGKSWRSLTRRSNPSLILRGITSSGLASRFTFVGDSGTIRQSMVV